MLAVRNGTKILIWKQFTTGYERTSGKIWAVRNGTKILIWKQFTTHFINSIEHHKLFVMEQRY